MTEAEMDDILATHALIPNEPTPGQEVDVPDWIVAQVEAQVRAEINEALDAARRLAFDDAARMAAAHMRGWNECLETMRRGDEVEPMVDPATEPYPDEEDDGA